MEKNNTNISTEFKIKFYQTMIEDLEHAMVICSELTEYEALINTKSELMAKLWELQNS